MPTARSTAAVQHGPGAKTLPVDITNEQYQEHEDEGGGDGQLGGQGLIVHMPENAEDGGGVVIQPAAYAAGLIEIKGDGLQERPAQEHGGEHQDDIGQGEDKEMAQLELALHPEYGQHRHNEHGLELKAEGEGHGQHGQHWPVVQGPVNAHEGQGHIYAVALSPEGAVEHDGGQEEDEEESRQTLSRGCPPAF